MIDTDCTHACVCELAMCEGLCPCEHYSSSSPSACSGGDRVSIDRDAMRVLCLTAGNLCRLRTDERVAAVRAAYSPYRRWDCLKGVL